MIDPRANRPAIRPAGPGDGRHLARFVRALARYERLEHELDLDEQRLEFQLAATPPPFSALLAESAGAPVGFALFFPTYSTFRAEPCLWLEDLFVLP